MKPTFSMEFDSLESANIIGSPRDQHRSTRSSATGDNQSPRKRKAPDNTGPKGRNLMRAMSTGSSHKSKDDKAVPNQRSMSMAGLKSKGKGTPKLSGGRK